MEFFMQYKHASPSPLINIDESTTGCCFKIFQVVRLEYPPTWYNSLTSPCVRSNSSLVTFLPLLTLATWHLLLERHPSPPPQGWATPPSKHFNFIEKPTVITYNTVILILILCVTGIKNTIRLENYELLPFSFHCSVLKIGNQKLSYSKIKQTFCIKIKCLDFYVYLTTPLLHHIYLWLCLRSVLIFFFSIKLFQTFLPLVFEIEMFCCRDPINPSYSYLKNRGINYASLSPRWIRSLRLLLLNHGYPF